MEFQELVMGHLHKLKPKIDTNTVVAAFLIKNK